MRDNVIRQRRRLSPGNLIRDYWRVSSHLWSLSQRRRGVSVGNAVQIAGFPLISMTPGSHISIGDRVSINSTVVSNPLGLNHRTIFRTLTPNASLRIGSDAGVSGASIAAAISISIGDRTLVGANCIIADTDFHPLPPGGRRYAPLPTPSIEHSISIGNDVFIGANCTILKGVSIGDGAVVGAGSIVARDVPANTVVAGNPARPVGGPQA